MSGGDLSTAVGLYYEHGGGAGQGSQAGSSVSNPVPTGDESGSPSRLGNEEDDFEMANRLQREMYEQQQNTEHEVRQPIMPTHDTLLPQEYGFGGLPNTGPQGDNDDDDDDDDNDNDYDQGLLGNYDLSGGLMQPSRPRMTSTQKRLANIFRPPWDIISKIDLDSAKIKARQEQKWILINIQDVTDFRCQCLNRDFWSSKQIKELVEENFIFVQYHNDSPSGEMYRNLYPFDEEYPHIAILDPITGERMIMWNTNPEIQKFIEQVVDFLTRYSADGTTAKVAPTSIGMNKEHAIALDDEEDEEQEGRIDETDGESDAEEILLSDEEEQKGKKQSTKELSYADKFNSIKAKDLPDPSSDIDPSLTTRIQIRSGIDGKRVVKKFLVNDPVLRVFEYAKFAFADSLKDRTFTLKMQRNNLGENLDKSIVDCQLKNASLLLEALDEDDDEDD
ncbi:hypothetical protein PMKS-003078 [Pichia membranifaciens]|uniref:UAS domain-containing protein n=1 Tax=Pichia membranifaciens TaxID=4926 RepID=A0A1Q2YJ50_9ASCO|nr:hypothetical protein PMKS-003078 [Pichia membranifaciens]